MQRHFTNQLIGVGGYPDWLKLRHFNLHLVIFILGWGKGGFKKVPLNLLVEKLFKFAKRI